MPVVLASYAPGMHLMLMIGTRGQYGVDLPDFMVFLDYAKQYPETNGLPPHWIPFKSFWFAAAAVVFAPGIVAFVFGFLAFRSRIKEVYFAILSQALTYAAALMFFHGSAKGTHRGIVGEPTECIQLNIIDQIGETLIKIKAEGKVGILLVEQYLDFCLSVGDSFYIMDRGAIVAEGPIANLNEDLVKEHLTV